MLKFLNSEESDSENTAIIIEMSKCAYLVAKRVYDISNI